jgi:hypothetical protein
MFRPSDMGLLEIHEKSLNVFGTKDHGGTQAYELQEKPRQAWYYSRIVDWIAAETDLPLERGPMTSAKPWRKQVYEDVAIVDAVPTPRHVRVDDVQSRDWSDYKGRRPALRCPGSRRSLRSQETPNVISRSLWAAK